MFVLTPLRHRRIAYLWSGQLFSAVGDELYKVALIWVAVDIAGTDAGFIAALEAGAFLIASILMGNWADRRSPRHVMIAADLARGLVVLSIPWLMSVFGRTLWTLLPAAILVAGLNPFFDPALQTVLPALVSGRDLLRATNGLLEGTRRLARIVGPGLIGVLSQCLAIVHFFTLDALTFFGSAFSIAAAAGFKSAKAPISHVAGNAIAPSDLEPNSAERLINFSIFTSSLVWAMWSLVFSLALAVRYHEMPNTTAAAYGLVIAAYGVGNLASNFFWASFPLRRPGLVMFSGVIILGVGFTALAFAPTLPWAMAAAAFAAIGGPMDDLGFVLVLQTRYQGEAVSRGFRRRLVFAYSGHLVVFLLSPWVLREISVTALIAICGISMALVGIIGGLRFHQVRFLN